MITKKKNPRQGRGQSLASSQTRSCHRHSRRMRLDSLGAGGGLQALDGLLSLHTCIYVDIIVLSYGTHHKCMKLAA